ncbi:MAG: pyridoxamine 5'-phosphate oxidase family protein [Acholeplasmataceae bacterium]|nr:pyridoxamine 5'-phosphate oxidase family protein [Acholeplasmataceae bacterium]
MELKASEIQKQRIKEIETRANELVDSSIIMFVTSINEKGYPRTCCVNKLHSKGFRDIYFVTSKRSEKQGKAKHFETNTKSSICFRHEGDSLTMVGDVELIINKTEMQVLWNENDKAFFPKGIDDPKIRFFHFHTLEATFWINQKFRTVKYGKSTIT